MMIPVNMLTAGISRGYIRIVRDSPNTRHMANRQQKTTGTPMSVCLPKRKALLPNDLQHRTFPGDFPVPPLRQSKF